MVGRDIGTVVLPEADLKVYLDAPLAERARRRVRELAKKGEIANYDTVRSEIEQRDTMDSQREMAPLQAASDAKVVHTDGLSVAEVLAVVREEAKSLK